MATQPAPTDDPNAAIYDALRKADAAGDSEAVAKLAGYLKTQPANDQAPLVTGGPQVEAGPQASRQLAPEDENALRHMLQNNATADEVRQFVSGKLPGAVINADKLVAARDAGRGVNGGAINYPLPKVQADDGATGAAIRGVGRGASFDTLDELGGAADGLYSLAHGGSYLDAYHKTVDRARGMEAGDEEHHAIASMAGQLIGGLVIPLAAEKAGLTATMEAVGLSAGKAALREGLPMAEARVVAQRAITKRLAAEGAAYGGAYGAGGAEGGVGERLEGAGIGAVEGAAGGAVLGAAGGRLAERARVAGPVAPTLGQEVGAAAERQGIDVLPADTGGPVIKAFTGLAGQTPFGVGPIIDAAHNSNATGEAAINRIAETLGSAAKDVEGIGTAAVEGSMKYDKAAKLSARAIYDLAGKKSAGVSLPLPSAAAKVDEQIARLEAVPGGGAGLSEARALRAALDKPYTVQGIRDMRTEMFVPPDFRNTPVEGRMKAVVDAAARDIEDGLRTRGLGDAADAFRSADRAWRERLVNLKRNIEPIIGKLDKLKGAEGVTSALNSAMKNNGARAGAFIRALPSDEQGVVRASMLNPLGRLADGSFSLSQFNTDWNKLSPIAKRAVFGEEATAALNDLATVGEGAKASKSFASHSNTPKALIAERTLGTLATGATFLAGLPTFIGAAVGQYGLGRLLASPRFARWLGRAPRSALSAPSYLERLGRIAVAEPAIAADVLKVQKALEQQLSPSRLAAQPEQGNEQQ